MHACPNNINNKSIVVLGNKFVHDGIIRQAYV